MRYLRYLFILIIVVLGTSFACLNATEVKINYFIGNSTLSLPLVLGACLLTGAILGVLVCVPSLIRLYARAHHWQKQAESATRLIEKNPAIPLQHDPK